MDFYGPQNVIHNINRTWISRPVNNGFLRPTKSGFLDLHNINSTTSFGFLRPLNVDLKDTIETIIFKNIFVDPGIFKVYVL